MAHRDKVDVTRGVAITSSFHPDELTHVEPVRYGKGSNAMGLLTTIATKGGGRWPRPLVWLAEAAKRPGLALSLYGGLDRWSERTIIRLAMEIQDHSLNLYAKRTRLGRLEVTSKRARGLPNPTWIPATYEANQRIAEQIDGFPGSSVGEIFDIPMTAHFLGGCAIGDSPETGVIDAYRRLCGHDGLHVVDGSTISANLGVMPSSTITAQTERAMALWPNKGEREGRPPVGADYLRLPPVAPRTPVVPKAAPGALRLPLVEVR